MNHKRIAHELSFTSRDLLIEHVDGSNDVPVPVYVTERCAARNGLIAKGLVRPDRKERATKTIITDDGRQVLAYVLGDYADALIRAGYSGLASPVIVRPRLIAVEASAPELVPAD